MNNIVISIIIITSIVICISILTVQIISLTKSCDSECVKTLLIDNMPKGNVDPQKLATQIATSVTNSQVANDAFSTSISNQVSDSLRPKLENIKTALESDIPNTLDNRFKSLDQVSEALETKLKSVEWNVHNIPNTLDSRFTSLDQAVAGIPNTLDSRFTSLDQAVAGIPNTLDSRFTSLDQAVADSPRITFDKFDDTLDEINRIARVGDHTRNIADKIKPMFQIVVDNQNIRPRVKGTINKTLP